MKRIFGTLALLSYLLVIGAVGAMEVGTVDSSGGMVRLGIAMACAFLFSWLAGAFDTEDKENRQRECPPISGKQEAQFKYSTLCDKKKGLSLWQ